jgi:hypothetical protein
MRTFIAVAAFAAVSNAIQLEAAPASSGSGHMAKFEGALSGMDSWNSYKKANKVNMDKAAGLRKKRAEEVAAYFKDVASADAAKKAMVAANGVSVAKTSAYNKAKAASIKAAAASAAANKTAAARQGDLTKALADEKKANDGNDAAVKAAKKN